MKDDAWDGISLEEWVEQKLKEGQRELVVKVLEMSQLTKDASKKEKYREIWKRVLAEKKGKV